MSKFWLMHHGVKGMHWGIQLGPPYPLSEQAQGVQRFLKDLSRIQYKNFDKLMSPEQVAKKRKGSCHDQTYYEYTELKKLGLNPKGKFLIEYNRNNAGGTTHSLVYFSLNGKTYWIENAWEDHKGVRKYTDERKMMSDVISKWEKDPDYPKLAIGNLDYDKLKPGMDLQDILDVVDFN